ncbi:hypothetical protein K488DRAFT_74945 [Vararia minispora EC-137]|uniref:Uncharacterized protein n=1 Tax=Vararia minispora EC-137 TaxID=1314806 RepID=A0ACB8Q5J4_9AGAM|nr:hypothetical protein K488DRAFT_74945 [Vararia minispora EC-137]
MTVPDGNRADVEPASSGATTKPDDPFTQLPDEFLAVLTQSGVAPDAVFAHDFVSECPAEGRQALMRYSYFHAVHVAACETRDDCLICVAILSETREELEGQVREARRAAAEAMAEATTLRDERDAAQTRMIKVQTDTVDRTTTIDRLCEEAAALHAQISELESSESHVFLEPGEDRATSMGIAALRAMIANVCTDHFRSLWAGDRRPISVLIYPYWPKSRVGPLNLWLDAATIRGYLLFKRTVSRMRNAWLFATALLVALDPTKYYNYATNNPRGWAVGEKLDCDQAEKIGALAADPEIVMQIWMWCGITPEHATDAFKYALYFTFEAYILRRAPDLSCPTRLLDLYEAVRMIDIYGRGPDGLAPMVHPWPAWIPSKMTISKVAWSGNQPPPPAPAVPLWDVDRDHLAPARMLRYIHEPAHEPRPVVAAHTGLERGLWRQQRDFRSCHWGPYPTPYVESEPTHSPGFASRPTMAPATYGGSSHSFGRMGIASATVPPMPASSAPATVSFVTDLAHNDIAMDQ